MFHQRQQLVSLLHPLLSAISITPVSASDSVAAKQVTVPSARGRSLISTRQMRSKFSLDV